MDICVRLFSLWLSSIKTTKSRENVDWESWCSGSKYWWYYACAEEQFTIPVSSSSVWERLYFPQFLEGGVWSFPKTFTLGAVFQKAVFSVALSAAVMQTNLQNRCQCITGAWVWSHLLPETDLFLSNYCAANPTVAQEPKAQVQLWALIDKSPNTQRTWVSSHPAASCFPLICPSPAY